MKAFSLSIIFFLFFLPRLKAQQEQENSKNEIKVNLSALLFRNISIQYERKISFKTTVALAAHLLPSGKIPFQNTVENFADMENIPFDQARVGSFGVVPEVRFYTGKKGAFNGFYLGPFLNFANYKTSLPITYNNKTGIFNGNISTMTVGIQAGIQANLSHKIKLDFWLLGPQFGASKGDLLFTGNLDDIEQEALRTSIDNVRDESPVKFIDTYSIDERGGKIKIKGPWAGLRAAGVNLCFSF